MSKYRVEFTPAALRQFKKLPKEIQRRVATVIDKLERNPYPDGAKKLTNEDRLFRVRIGDYRVVYQVENKQLLVLVVRVRHRKEVCR